MIHRKKQSAVSLEVVDTHVLLFAVLELVCFFLFHSLSIAFELRVFAMHDSIFEQCEVGRQRDWYCVIGEGTEAPRLRVSAERSGTPP